MSTRKPPFRADHVGSLLRPAPVKDARARFAAGEIDADALRGVEDAAVIELIACQEAAGLEGITDGEARRSWWHLDFLWGLDGCEKQVMDRGSPFAGTETRAEGAMVTGKLGWSGHQMIEHFKFLKDHTSRTPKMTIPAPSALYGRPVGQVINRDVYPTNDSFFADLGAAYNKAVHAFADAGCRYLQLDEVFIAMLCDEKYRQTLRDRGDDPDRTGEIFVELVNAAVEGIPDDMTITMHFCRGNFRSTHAGEGGYEPVAKLMFDNLNIDGFFMEYDTERAGDFTPLRHFTGDDQRIVLGLVTTKLGELEDRDALMRRIEEAAKIVPLDNLCLSPQCGFASTEEGNILAEEQQWAKLKMIVEVAEEVWGEL